MRYAIKAQSAQLTRRIHSLIGGLEDATPLMRVWSEVALASVARNFNEGGRPSWQPLAAATILRKGHDKPLIDSGTLKNIVSKVNAQSVTLGTQPAASAYAAIQNYGGQAGRGRATTIPAREYMLLQAEDIVELRESARDYLQRRAAP